MILKVNAEQRTTERKSDLTKLRKSGLIPAVLYGKDTEALKITLNKAEFMKLYKKSLNELVFYEILVAGKEYHTLVKERQIHPVSREILHLDFMIIPPHQSLEIEVPLRFTGNPIGVKEGGIMDIAHRTLKIQCQPEDIPTDIEIDISNINIGEALHVNQIPVGKWTVKDHGDNAVLSIHAKRIEAEPVVEAKTEETAPVAETKEKG